MSVWKGLNNGKGRLVIGLLVLTLVVLMGTYYDLGRRMDNKATIAEIVSLLTTQRADTSKLVLPADVLEHIEVLQRDGTEVSQRILEHVEELQRQLDANTEALERSRAHEQ